MCQRFWWHKRVERVGQETKNDLPINNFRPKMHPLMLHIFVLFAKEFNIGWGFLAVKRNGNKEVFMTILLGFKD
jgi:hypothetical protein